MELTKYAKAIKAELAMELSMQGKSIQDFENTLESINTGESVYKFAEVTSGITGNIMGALTTLPEFAFKGSLAGGALTGLTLDEMDKSVQDVNKSLEREREKIKLVRRITENLKREHGII